MDGSKDVYVVGALANLFAVNKKESAPFKDLFRTDKKQKSRQQSPPTLHPQPVASIAAADAATEATAANAAVRKGTSPSRPASSPVSSSADSLPQRTAGREILEAARTTKKG